MNNKSKFDFKTTFPPLGHPEHHFNRCKDHPWLKKEKEIKDWLKESLNKGVISDYYNKLNMKDFIVHEDLTISYRYTNDIKITFVEQTYLPVQFREVKSFSIDFTDIENLVGTPYKSDYLFIQENKKLKSLIGLKINSPKIMDISGNHKNLSFNGMPSLEGSNLIITWKKELSWDGFTSCKTLTIKLDKDFEINSFFEDFIYNIPDSIEEISFETSWKYDLNKLKKFNCESIREYRKALKNKDLINENLKILESNSKKRKL